MCARSHSCRACCASPRRSARMTISCSPWARLANPRRNRKRSMPITTAATEPSTMMIIVIPPVCSSSFSSTKLIWVQITRLRRLLVPMSRSSPFSGTLRRMGTWSDLALECARAARAALQLDPAVSPVAVVLGSGLGAFGEQLSSARSVSFADLPGLPRATVLGHKGRLVLGELEGIPVLAQQGRLHGYEGHDAATVAFPARVLRVLGARALILTNAAGGLNPHLQPGDLMRITDHINLTARNPLVGPNEELLGPRFPDLSRAYTPALAAALEEAARETGIALRRGVYAQFLGPSYETPAEVRMARILGADAVGMSTVPEVIAAAHMGLPVAGISCITNHAAGMADKPLTHQEVVAVAQQVEGRFLQLLRAFLPRAAAAVPPRKALA